jgi:hypothetical protein
MSCTGPKRVEVLRDAVTMRGPVIAAGGAGLLSGTPATAGAVGLGAFALTMRMGMATGVLRFGGRLGR